MQRSCLTTLMGDWILVKSIISPGGFTLVKCVDRILRDLSQDLPNLGAKVNRDDGACLCLRFLKVGAIKK